MIAGYLGPVLWLSALWVILWRSTTPATIITGLALAVAATWAAQRSDQHRERHRVHPVALLRYAGHMVVALVRSNVELAKEILTPTDYTHPGVLEIRLPACSELVLTAIANSITLTPGTLSLELRAETSTLAVHVLHLRDIDKAREEIETLHRLVSAALVAVEVAPGQEATQP